MSGAYKRDGVTWLCYAFLAYYSYFLNTMGPMTPLLKGELGLSYGAAGLHYTAFALGIIAVGLAGEAAIARLGKRRALWVGAFGTSLCVIPLTLGRSALVTIPSCFAMGLVGSLVLIIVPSTLSERHGELRAIALSESNVIASAVSATPPILIGLCVRSFGNWRPALAVVALLPLVMLAATRRTRPAAQGAAAQAPAEAGKRPLPRAYWAYWSGIFLAVCAEFGMISWSSDFLASVHGLDKAASASALSVFMIAMIAGRALGSALARRFAAHALLLASLGVAVLGFAAFWTGASLPLALAGLFAAGIGISGLYPFLLSLALGVAGEQAVRASAVATLASGAAIMVLPALLGRAADAFGIRAAYALMILVFAALAAIVAATRASVGKAGR